MNNKKEVYDPLSFLFRIYEPLTLICAIPSMTVILFLRYRMGYRFVNPLVVGLAIMGFMSLGSIGNLFGGGGMLPGDTRNGSAERYALQFVFGVVMAVLAFKHRRIGWKLIFDRLHPWHTRSRGLSHLSRILPIPTDIVQRFIEPLVSILFGSFLMLLHLPFLGGWFVFAGICLAAMEQLVYEEEMNAMLDPLDAQTEAIQAKKLRELIENGGKPQSRPMQQSGGMRMTVSPEIMALMRPAPE